MESLFYDSHWPLSVIELLKNLLGGRTQDPNTPNVPSVSGVREWYSQRRPAVPGKAPKPIVYWVAGTSNLFYINGRTTNPITPPGMVADTSWVNVNRSIWDVQAVLYPAALIPMSQSIARGKAALIEAIESRSGPFALAGTSQGALIASLVYKEVRSGSLQHRRRDLIAGTMFGNPFREQGVTFPGGPDPSAWNDPDDPVSHGIFAYEHRLQDTESFWWEFANPGDPVATSSNDNMGEQLAFIVDLVMLQSFNVNSLFQILLQVFDLPASIDELLDTYRVVQSLTNPNYENPHTAYNTLPAYEGATQTASQIATNYLNQIGAQWQDSYTFSNQTEVLTIRYKLPLSMSELSFEILRVPVRIEVWYQDRLNNWRQALDRNRLPVSVTVSGSSTTSWYPFHTDLYPIVAKAFQLRMTRIPDALVGNIPYSIGIRNTLPRRTVYERNAGQLAFEDELDPFGNVISKYIRDWDATKAIDSNTTTYWKSAPQPDPSAVVSLYSDCRGADGSPRLMDKVYIDPVYSNQMVNIYYSNDDTVGVRKLSPISVLPLEDANTSWRIQRGRLDEASGVSESYYRFKLSFGPLVKDPMWFGIEWTPNFDALDGPAENPVLLGSVLEGTDVLWHPRLVYDVGAGEFQLEFTDGSTVRNYTAPLTSAFTAGSTLRIVVGWKYDPDTIHIVVTTRDGVVIASLDDEPTNLPGFVSLDGVVEIANFRGLLTATLIKLEDYSLSSQSFLLNPNTYTSPDPVIPDSSGQIPSTTLDNAIYAASWTEQEHGTGGSHESAFTSKEWTPIWRNYTAEKGTHYFPRAISAKYLKLEFTNLNEEPYPIYESGIEVKYLSFPISVQQQSSQGPRIYTGAGGILGLGSFISVNGIKAINWLNPASIQAATQSIFGKVVDPVQINVGQGYVTGTLPNMVDTPISTSYRVEAGTAAVYRRTELQPYILAQNEVESLVKTEGLAKIAPYTSIPWRDIQAQNQGAIQTKSSPGLLPIRGEDYWIVPGQTLRISAAVMEKLTSSSTVVERKLTSEKRVRFTTTSVHKYEMKTIKRDAAIAYFAGVREFFPLNSTYILGEDKDTYDFTIYDSSQWVFNNIKQIESGSVTTQNPSYTVENPLFLKSIANWVQAQGVWTWNSGYGHWGKGSIQTVADSTNHNVYSTLFDISEGNVIKFSVWVKWTGLSIENGDPGPTLGLVTYLNETPVDYPVIEQLVSDDWPLYPNSNNWDVHIDGWVQLTGSYTVPAGVNRARIRLNVPDTMIAGTVQYDWVALFPDSSPASTLFKNFQTTSKFSKLKIDFRDSGLVRSNAMWSDDDPSDGLTNQLAYYTETIPAPEELLSGMWGDSIKTWGGENVEWGTPFSVVSITVDGEKVYQGKRVLHFRRAAGAGNAGVKVRQWTNIFTGALARIGAVVLKPFDTENVITVRLRRLSDGVFIHEESFVAPTGRYFEFQSKFFVIPEDDPIEDTIVAYPDEDFFPGELIFPGMSFPTPHDTHLYEVSLTLSGDAEDEVYVNDLYTELAHIRYFARMGGSSNPLMEITDLVYKDAAYVTWPTPVNEASIQAAFMSPKSYAFGATITPCYLQ